MTVTSEVDPEVYVEADGKRAYAGRIQPSEQLRVEVPADTHTVVVQCVREGYLTWRSTLVPHEGRGPKVHCAQVQARQVMRVRTTAPRTTLFLDDSLLGGLYTAPEPFVLGPVPVTTAELSPGRWYAWTRLPRGAHKLCARAPGHAEACQSFDASLAEKPVELTFVMEAAAPIRRPLRSREPDPATAPALAAGSDLRWAPAVATHAGAQAALGDARDVLLEQEASLMAWPGPRWAIGALALVSESLVDATLGWGVGLRVQGKLEPGADHLGWAALVFRQQGSAADEPGDAERQLYRAQVGLAWRLVSGLGARAGFEAGIDETRARSYAEGRLQTTAERRASLALFGGLEWSW